MKRYFDSAYIAKCYLFETDGGAVRHLATESKELCCSGLCIAELAVVFHRHVRELKISHEEAEMQRSLFLADVGFGYWKLFPVTGEVLAEVEFQIRKLPSESYIRSADAIHLVTAALAGFSEIWTNDRHMLAAAPHFGIAGQSV